MKQTLARTIAAATIGLIVLAGCSSKDTPAASAPNTPAVTTTSAPATASTSSGGATEGTAATSAPDGKADAATASSSLGEIVVDGKGMTAYYFDKDTANSGTSACTGECALAWPAITAAGSTPVVDGVTGKVGTIDTAGGKQITINGRPIYTFAKDSAAGDVNGQGVGGTWFVISPNGDELKTAAGSSSAAASSSPSSMATSSAGGTGY
ncbi:hypothetical protein D1871_04060 [Nakamurella silvestris]|nr:hypothetical protein D1871_04060 [Nakamurella silvestris]